MSRHSLWVAFLFGFLTTAHWLDRHADKPMTNKGLAQATRNRRNTRPGPLSRADLEDELWHALKSLDDPYELDENRLTRLSQIEALASRRLCNGAFTKGESLAGILSSCIERISEKAVGDGEFSRCARLLSGIAQGHSLTQVSQELHLTQEHVTRRYRRKAMKILVREFRAELQR